MPNTIAPEKVAEEVHAFVRRDFAPRFGQLTGAFPGNAVWRKLRELGTELWLDTGDLEEARALWTGEMTALTTNNTLLNKEVQKGQYDDLIRQAARMLRGLGLADRELMLEIAFILNARHGLRLVHEFDAFVSVEEHTELAGDVEAAVAYARRYHAVCPERFIVKIPFTPAGLLATRRLVDEGIAVNHTLGFSARQNYVISRLAGPEYVNVFLGRLNSFVADNKLGSGQYVGERATVASQRAIQGTPSKQIGASFRAAEQVRDLAGLDVMTMPPKVAGGFLKLGLSPGDLQDRTGENYNPPLAEGVDPQAVRLDTLWDVNEEIVACVDGLQGEDIGKFTPQTLVKYFADHRCGDCLVEWTEAQIAAIRQEGKIPRYDSWKQALSSGRVGLDALMNLAGLYSFVADQQAMDDRVREVLTSL